MLRERTFLDWPLLVGLLAVTVDLMIGMPAQPQRADEPMVVVAPPAEEITDSMRVEDQLGDDYRRMRAIALDPATPPIDAFEAVSRARTLAVVLELPDDGVLLARTRVTAPAAAAAYRAAGDLDRAAVAETTAEMAGPR